VLASLKSLFQTLDDFEQDFPSLCFALATGVGKTRLMGAFIAYLHLAHGINNFFVLAPNLTIYNKLIADFTRNTPKYDPAFVIPLLDGRQTQHVRCLFGLAAREPTSIKYPDWILPAHFSR
jgi:hypothetical protein